MSKVKKTPGFHCNICGCPATVKYYEKCEDTGAMKEKSHIVPCLGHSGVLPHLWNMHPLYDKFHQYFINRSKDNA